MRIDNPNGHVPYRDDKTRHFVAFIPHMRCEMLEEVMGEVPEHWIYHRSAHWLMVRAPSLTDIVHLRFMLDDIEMDGVMELIPNENLPPEYKGFERVRHLAHDEAVEKRNREAFRRRGWSVL